MFSAGVGVVFSKKLESGVGFDKVRNRSQFFELVQFMGWSRSRNPEKSSDSTTLVHTPSFRMPRKEIALASSISVLHD